MTITESSRALLNEKMQNEKIVNEKMLKANGIDICAEVFRRPQHPGAQLLTQEGVGHAMPEEEWDRLAAAILRTRLVESDGAALVRHPYGAFSVACMSPVKFRQ